MIEYLKIYQDRLAKSAEVIEDARASGDDEELREAFALLGKEFYAAMQYAFLGQEPDFSRRSLEGSEWRDWRSDIDRSEAKMSAMRDLGSKGGAAKAKNTAKKNATPQENDVATVEKNVATVEAETKTESDANENPSPKVNTKVEVNTKVKSKVEVKSKVNPKVNTEVKTESLVAEQDEVEVKKHTELHQEEQAETYPQGYPQTYPQNEQGTASTSATTADALKQLCEEFPCIDSAGFRAEIRKDIEEYSPGFVRKCLFEADKSNSREKVSYAFYKSIRNRLWDDAVSHGMAAAERRSP